MADPWTWASAVSLAIWLYLMLGRAGFWRAHVRLERDLPTPATWPEVVVVVPARNEADVIGESLASLLAQDYPGRFSIVVVDDASTDGTAEAARATRSATSETAVEIVVGDGPALGWTGKLWALEQGLCRARTSVPDATFVWFSDADIFHGRDILRRLVAKAEADSRDLVSLMVRLHCAGLWERLLIPAFVFFFQMLYPFAATADPRKSAAGAAGGCLLVRRAALERAGGLAPIRGDLIDDCALAQAVKSTGGRLWLGLGEDSYCIRAYDGLGGIWALIARGAYSQLRFSPVLLAGTVAGMVVTYLVPPVTVIAGALGSWGAAASLATGAWGLMCISYQPTLAYYRQPWYMSPLLPLVAGLYMMATGDSARRHWRGRGAAWKGRHYAPGPNRAETNLTRQRRDRR